jgi:ribonuclease-3
MEDLEQRKQKIVEHIAEKTGYDFKATDILFIAMTHSSIKEEGLECNERLEFLGDAILGHVACEHLFKIFPDHQEGDLSVIKSILVSAKMLSKAAADLGLGEIVITGKGIAEKKLPKSILANAFEALTAAIYLDSDLETSRSFLMKHLIEPYLDEISKNPQERNYKSLLQDYVQKSGMPLPGYRVARSTGPDHRKRFQVFVEVGSHTYGPTWGYSKKEAEQKAARNALLALGLLNDAGEDDMIENGD